MEAGYDAVVVVSFGGPEAPDDVVPFLENVLRGRDVPRARLDEVAEHYRLLGGVSPVNSYNRSLVDALRVELKSHQVPLAVYWGNRNWEPYLVDAVAQMRGDGVRRALAFVTSAYGSYSSCRQYLDDIAGAGAAAGPGAPSIDKLRLFYNHPGFVEAWIESLGVALGRTAGTTQAPAVLFSAHSIPVSMAVNCDYVAQLTETARLVAAGAGVAPERWRLVWQSRSGRPDQPWLEPDVVEVIRQLPGGAEAVVVAPIGFLSDNIEILYDLDTVATDAAALRHVRLERAATPGAHPRLVAMVRELVCERLRPPPPGSGAGRLPSGDGGTVPDRCRPGCCLPAGRP
ncbi:MAG: ferrochelatase [Acidimicrobiales bacterium]